MLEQILEKQQEFNQYLDSIDLSVLKEQYTRSELDNFSNQLYSLKTRSLAFEVKRLTDEMKKEEYPELLGVHHFPVLRQIDFLTEEQKIELDKFLVSYRKGNYVSGLWRITKKHGTVKEIEKFLLDKGVVEERHYAICPKCDQGYISSLLTPEQKQGIEKIITENESEERYEYLDTFLDHVCMECDRSTVPEEIETLNFKTVYKMVQERDTSLDNV
ncbi:hypothetical protein [Brevibacillus borstelensis]|uniref:hypothetical protein n=1 Tax=Brevibacillus borstelensis TaxID=45462 RepID=UPI0030BBC278